MTIGRRIKKKKGKGGENWSPLFEDGGEERRRISLEKLPQEEGAVNSDKGGGKPISNRRA